MKAIRWLACVLALATLALAAIGLLGLRSAAPAAAGATLVVDVDGLGSASNCDSTTAAAYPTIQAAIDAAAADDIISVCPGTYNQDEANGWDPKTGLSGSNDFNIFVNKAQLTIQGVNASGVPITDYSLVAAQVIAKRQLPTFGASTIFVQADGVTITGLDITGWQVDDYWDNKTLEVVGDSFTLKDCALHALDTVSSLYFDDVHFDAGTMTSHVQSYDIEGNLLDGGGPDAAGIRISSGPGWSGDVTGRVITGNTFSNTMDGIEFVGPGADPWDFYPVGDATITGNSFGRSDRRHVIAWGEYPVGSGNPGYINLDWQGIVQNNTFDKAAITWAPGGDARAWDLAPFKNVRGIYSAIQRYAINKAVAGDTVQVLPGTYNERLTITQPLDLRGAQYGVDPTQPGARTTPANESTIDLTGLAVTNPNVLIDIANGVSNVSVAGFTLIGSPTFHYADEAIVRAWTNGITVKDNIMNGYIGVLYKGPGQNLQVLRNRTVFNKNGLVVQGGTLNTATVSGNTFTLGSSPATDLAAIYMTATTLANVTGNTATGIAINNGRGLYGSGLTQLTASGNKFTGDWDAISIFGGSTSITITNNDLSSSARYGLNIKGQNISITGNKITSCGDSGVSIDRNVIDTQGVTISNNDLSGNALYGVKVNTALVTQIVNAENNWWGSANGPAHVSNTFNVGAQGVPVSDGADFVPWLNAAPPGGVSFAPVTTTSPVGSYASIQAGATASNSGGTVDAKAGTFTEQPDIAKPLTLTGAGQASTIIKSPAALATKFATNKPVVYIHDATGVTLQQLTVDGDGKGNANSRMEGVAFYNAGGTVDHVTITRVRETPLSGAQHGVALYAYNIDGVPRTLNVSNNTISDYQKNGMALSGAGLTTTVTDNTVTGSGPTGVTAQNGIQVGFGATGTVEDNTVANVSYTGDYYGASGILVTSYSALGYPPSSADVTSNTVTNAQVGIYYGEGSGQADGNTVSASAAGVGRSDFWGIVVVDPPGLSASPFEDEAAPPAGGFSEAPMSAGVMTVVVSGNTLTGDGTADSVGLEADAGYGPEDVSFTASGNTISNWGTGVVVAQCTEDCSGARFTSVDVGPDNNISAPIADPSNSGLHAMGSVNLNVHNNTFTGGYDAVRLRLSVTGTVNDNVMSGYAKNGITVGKAADDNTGTNMTISGNTVTGGGPGQVNAQNGIQVGPNAVAMIEYNTVSNHVYTLGTGACAGPGTKGDAAYYDACYTAAGVMVYQGSATVTGNIITGNQIGVDDSGAETHYNIIRDNIIFGVNNVSAGVANAENNWWGSCSGPYHPTLNPYGLGDAVSDHVGFAPWISGPCDTDGDGLTDDQEKLIFLTNPNDPDTDHDGFYDDGVDVDGPGPGQPNDNCPLVSNPGQENADNQIGNGTGIPGHDSTVPNSAGDNIGDACDSPDADNDGIPNASDTDPGGDITYDDNNNGIMCPVDAADDGPSWDHNCNGILDGKDLVPGSCPLAVNPNGDDDGDGLKNTWEVCKWGTDPAVQDSDGDTLGDCTEAVDTDGNGIIDFGGDAINSARATLLPAGIGPGKFGKDGDFDLNGNNVVAGDYGTDTLETAKFALGLKVCK